jgi:hypothetical protein
MKIFLTLALIAWAVIGPAAAGDYTMDNRPAMIFSGRGGEKMHMSPFPMSSRAAAVWNSDACWRACGAKCGGQFNACGRANGAEACRSGLDRCDRICVWQCRSSGGPLLYSFE